MRVVGWLGWMVGLDGWLDGWLGWMVGWLDGWLDGWMVGWLVGWLDGWLVGWMVGWLVGCYLPGLVCSPGFEYLSNMKKSNRVKTANLMLSNRMCTPSADQSAEPRAHLRFP